MKEPKIRFKEFSGEWEEENIASIASLRAGKSIDTSQEISYPSQGYYPCYGGNGLRGYVQDYTHDGTYNIIGRQGALCGNVKIVSGKFHATEHAVVVSPIRPIDPYCLYNVLTKANINQYATGVAQPGISVQNVNKSLFISMPEFKEQQAIASYFTNLDSLIQSTAKKIEKLKQIKAASLQSMFPQEGETKPRVRFKGFEGEWETSAFYDIANRVSASASTYYYPGVEFEDVNAGEGTLNKDVTKKKIVKIGKLFTKGDVLFGKLRPYLKNILLTDFSGVAVGDFWVLRPKAITSELLYILTNSQEFMRVSNISSGSKMPRADWNLVSSSSFLYPKSKAEQQAIASYFTSLDNQISLQTQRLEKLKQIKSACLDNMFV